MASKRRILRSFRIDEISGVDRPAQIGARVAILKRNSASEANMTEEEIKKMKSLEKSVEGLAAIVGLSADERGHYDKLEGDDAKAAWLAKSGEERKAEIAEVVRKAADDDVVYTTTDGDEIKKSHGDIVLKLAKSHDAERKKTARLEAEKEQSGLEKRADEELKYLPGDVTTRAAMLKAVEEIPNEDTRKAAMETLKSQNAQMAKAFETEGTCRLPRRPTRPTARLDKLAEERFTKMAGKETKEQAYAKVMETPQGKELYNQSVKGDSKRNPTMATYQAVKIVTLPAAR